MQCAVEPGTHDASEQGPHTYQENGQTYLRVERVIAGCTDPL